MPLERPASSDTQAMMVTARMMASWKPTLMGSPKT